MKGPRFGRGVDWIVARVRRPLRQRLSLKRLAARPWKRLAARPLERPLERIAAMPWERIAARPRTRIAARTRKRIAARPAQWIVGLSTRGFDTYVRR